MVAPLAGLKVVEVANWLAAPSCAALMRDMGAAVARLRSAIDRRERILIYGDYDVDGTSAVVILKKAIELAGGEAVGGVLDVVDSPIVVAPVAYWLLRFLAWAGAPEAGGSGPKKASSGRGPHAID